MRRQKTDSTIEEFNFVDGNEAWRWYALVWHERPLYENVLKTSERKLAKYSNNMINVIQLAAAVVVVAVTKVLRMQRKRKKEERSEVIRCENFYCFSFRKTTHDPI